MKPGYGLPLLVLALVLSSAPTSAQELRITAESEPGFSPWSSVRYTLWVTPDSATLSLTRAFPGGHGLERRVGIVAPDALRDVLARLEACGVESLGGAKRKGAHQAWVFSTLRNATPKDPETARIWTFRVEDPGLQPDRRYIRCLDALRDLAAATLDPIPFRDTFFEPGTFGYLQVASTPTAQVWLDGVDLALLSPIFGLRVPAGVHIVRFVDKEAGIDRSYDVKILPDVTTRLDVELW